MRRPGRFRSEQCSRQGLQLTNHRRRRHRYPFLGAGDTAERGKSRLNSPFRLIQPKNLFRGLGFYSEAIVLAWPVHPSGNLIPPESEKCGDTDAPYPPGIALPESGHRKW